MSSMVSSLMKTAGLSGITNELWKYCDKSVLDMLLVLLNFCLDCESGVLTNTCPIALIETTRKVFFKILSDQISLACSTFDVLCGDNFSVLKDALEKNQELWLVLQNMHKAYDSVGWEHLKRSLIRIKMCNKFIRFFGSIYNSHTNKVITDFVGSSQAATQHILNIASDFFCLNDISINNDKIVTVPYLTISGLPISIAKRGESHHYLGIFLFSKSLLKPSLVKAHSDVWFFINFILRKVISDKQFAYLVSLVLLSIDALIYKSLKSKSGLPLDFSNDVLYHSSLYNLKTFKQIQAESKSASVIAFVNLVGVLGRLFFHRSHDFQILSWYSRHPLLFPVHVRVSSLNNFLAGVVCIFSGCNLSLSGSLAGAFCFQNSTFMSLVLGKKRLDPHGPVPFWFDLSVRFFGGIASLSGHSPHEGVCGSSDIRQSLGFGVICNDLLNVGAACLSVYTDGSLSNLSTVDMLAGAAVFFEDIDSDLGMEVSGLVSFTLAELQAIALAFECVSFFHSVDLFSDSQAALDACRLEPLSVGPNFRNCCWIECCHIANVKSHLGVSGNNKRFLKTSVNTVSGNLRHFVCDVFRSIHRMYWEVGSGFQVVPGCLCANIDWLRSSLVWHFDSHLALSFTSAFHCWLPVAVWKHLYNRSYPSVMYLFCGDIEVSDHIFSCTFNTVGRVQLLNTYILAWETCSSLVQSSSCVSQLLSFCVANVAVGAALYKSFVFGDWNHESVLVFRDFGIVTLVIVDFVCAFCLSFWDDIWLVCAKYQAFMEKNRLIPHDSSIPASVSGSLMLFSPGVVRLLGVAKAFGVAQQVQIIGDNLKINSVTGRLTTSRKREFTANKYQQHYRKETKNLHKNKFKVATTPDTTTLEYYQSIYTHCKQKFNIPDGIKVVKKSVYQYIENRINNYLFGNYNISEVRNNLYNNLVHYSQLETEDLNSETLATYFYELNFNIIKYCEETYLVQSQYTIDFELETETSNKNKLKQYSRTIPNTPTLPKTTAKHLQTPEQGTSSKLLLTITPFLASLAQAQTPNSLLN
ncbi:hypothetical protein G9A89_005337 [Geosiphon pyriformis]|nr:hypothetical protein G9A89_005337 [Geosiphon pyriformis]